MSPGFAELYDTHIAASLDKQLFLNDLVGGLPWTLDMAQGTLRFADDMVWKIQVLGTQSEISSSWLWGWANEASNIPANLLESASAMRQFGNARHIVELVTPHFPVDQQIAGHDIAVVSNGVCGTRAYYRGPYEGGAVFLLINDPDFPPNIVDPAERMVHTFTKVVSDYPCNHRRALKAYADYYGVDVNEEGSRIRIASSGKELFIADFDEHGWVTNLQHD